MIDPIGIKNVGRDLALSRVQPVASASPVAQSATTQDTAALTGTAQSLSAAPPVDTDRVARVKKAIADGKFPLTPATVADRLIAYKLEWMSNDQA
jgi:negative regulator of flagellin synthesis FlgM